jgi:hypothetical protein
LALRAILRRRAISVASGAKRTFGETQLQNRVYEYAPWFDCAAPAFSRMRRN